MPRKAESKYAPLLKDQASHECIMPIHDYLEVRQAFLELLSGTQIKHALGITEKTVDDENIERELEFIKKSDMDFTHQLLTQTQSGKGGRLSGF